MMTEKMSFQKGKSGLSIFMIWNILFMLFLMISLKTAFICAARASMDLLRNGYDRKS